jgi:hypothetical protein
LRRKMVRAAALRHGARVIAIIRDGYEGKRPGRKYSPRPPHLFS